MRDWIDASGSIANLRTPIVLARELPFRLGRLMIEPQLRRVSTDDGGEEFLQARVMQVLVALARAEGEILTRDDLAECCWGSRVVGDDSLNRVIARLRRLAAGIGAGSFAVETITKVGYRLLPLDVPQSAPASSAAQEQDRPEADAHARLSRAIWSLAAMAMLIVAAGAVFFAFRSSSPLPLTVNLDRFETAGPGLPQGVAASIDSELRAAFSETAVPVTTGDADLLVTGAVRRIEGDRLRLSARVNDAASGAMLWSGIRDRPIANGEAQVRFAAEIAGTLDCALDAVARHGERLPEGTMSLTFQLCAEVVGGDSGRQLVAARRLVRDAADFWLGWHFLAYAIGGLEMTKGGVRDPALSAEAAAAARRVIALEPKEAEGYSQLALALPPRQAAEREALLRRAVAANPEECACAIQMLGDFLLQAGRLEEAASFYQRAVDQNRTIPLGLWRLAMGDYLRGRNAAGDEALRRARAIGGESPRMNRIVALWTGRWDDAARMLQAPQADEQTALTQGLDALAAGGPSRIAMARASVERLPDRAESELLVVPILAALGGIDSAFDRLETSLARGGHYSAPGRMPGLSRPLLFDPLLRPLWHDPRFSSLLERAGFIAYWRESGSRPDMCGERNPPGFCARLGD